ncbi:hypothetical protein Q8A73_003753 [Channa argus]|nr:hypothetical protein Q8A73_003753 [Channa argus]
MSCGTEDSRYCQHPSGSPGVIRKQARRRKREKEEEEGRSGLGELDAEMNRHKSQFKASFPSLQRAALFPQKFENDLHLADRKKYVLRFLSAASGAAWQRKL